MQTFTIESLRQIAKAPVIETIHNDQVRVVLNEGEAILHLRDAVLHAILWRPFYEYGIPVTEDDVYKLHPMNSDTICKAQTHQYKKLLDIIPNVPHTQIVMCLWYAIYEVHAFSFSYLGAYQQSIDLIDFIDAIKAPELDDLIRVPLPLEQGTRAAETEIRRRSKLLVQRLSTKGMMAHNPLLCFMEAKVFKSNQVPQLLMAFGPRSDIDDHVLPHVMTCSGVSGMASVADMFTESTSSKKTTHFNDTIIRDVQSWHREMRLFTCNLNNKYDDDCGRREMVHLMIPKGRGHNYVDKLVEVDGELLAVTHENCRELEDRKINMISPVFCNHADGVCAHCAGRATKYPWKFIPNVRLGGYGTSIICSLASQKVLSAKHLIQVITIMARLRAETLRYFSLDANNNIKLEKSKISNLETKYLLIPCDSIGHLNDLDFSGITPEGFGYIREVGIFDSSNGATELFHLTEDSLIQHLSEYMLKYLRDNRETIEIHEGHYLIPLKDINTRRSIFTVVELNDDMKAFVKRIRKMFRSGVSECPNIHMAISQIANMVHAKMDVNIFFIELVIKAIVNSVIDKDGNVQLKKLNEGISSFNVATKLGHGWVKKYLQSPEVSAVDKGSSPFDSMYGW